MPRINDKILFTLCANETLQFARHRCVSFYLHGRAKVTELQAISLIG